jgi:hypothetical protein
MGSSRRYHAAGVAPAACIPRAAYRYLRGYARQPGDADLRAQFKLAQQDVEETLAELRALEAQWGFGF